MVCREPLVGGPVVLGSETVRAFGSGYWFGPVSHKEGPWLAPIFTFAMLTYLAIKVHMGGKPSLLRCLVTYYAFITALVEITRVVWDVSRHALTYAALHNLAEWGIIGLTVYAIPEAKSHWLRSQLWILAVCQWIWFAPTLTEAGLGEQIAGLSCDWLLVMVWARLYHVSDEKRRKYVLFGLLGAIGHMAEILPLVSLLIGVVSTPSIPGCILIAFTTPITFWLYGQMVNGWEMSGDEDLVTVRDTEGKTVGSNSLKTADFAKVIAVGVLLSMATILGPAALIKPCAPDRMKLTPGQSLPHDTPYACTRSTTQMYTGTDSGNPHNGLIPNPRAHGVSSTSAASIPPPPMFTGGQPAAASNESLCASKVKLTGTTTIIAKPGHEQELIDMVATMPGPVRQEYGNIYYNEAVDAKKGEIKFFESWSSVRSLYKHIHMSDTVKRTFRSQAFNNILQDMKLEGPFQAMVPCSEAQGEAQPVSIPFSTVMDAPMECLWARFDNWFGDFSWVKDSIGVSKLGENLRMLHFPRGIESPVYREPNVPQPENGHTLFYYMLDGAFMDTVGEVYRGHLTIVPSSSDPSKTLFTYTATIVAKTPAQTGQFYDQIFNDFINIRVPFLQQWARGVATTCHLQPQQQPAATTTYVPTQPAATHVQAPSQPHAPVSTTGFPSVVETEWFLLLSLPKDGAAAAAKQSAAGLLHYLTSKLQITGPQPQAVYAAAIGNRNLPGRVILAPDLQQKGWDASLVVRLPVGSTISPADIGKGVALDVWSVQVRAKTLPTEEDAQQCPDSPQLAEAIEKAQPTVNAMFGQIYQWKGMVDVNPNNLDLPVQPNAQMSGVNLLKYRKDALGYACYHRYLRATYNLIHSYGGGLVYYAEVIKNGSMDDAAQWDEIVIPLYNSGNVFFKVAFDPSYRWLMGLRDAAITDVGNIDVTALPGSSYQIP